MSLTTLKYSIILNVSYKHMTRRTFSVNQRKICINALLSNFYIYVKLHSGYIKWTSINVTYELLKLSKSLTFKNLVKMLRNKLYSTDKCIFLSLQYSIKKLKKISQSEELVLQVQTDLKMKSNKVLSVIDTDHSHLVHTKMLYTLTYQYVSLQKNTIYQKIKQKLEMLSNNTTS